ncbi:hypothetical protein N5U14_01550 [Aliarcobacter butzleri]|uniref:hypothetical protein n=1 Tax=Aliarcobacter butzleri TaxID=28197 RepID=UPI0021B41B14|nr:hypothetical protein [Aliarcobacter butzleri]MCT7609528.1 hypothetical protein [Aliarcobacter butzleri]
MKKIFLIMVSLFTFISVANASSISKIDFESMNKIDRQFLFDGEVNVVALNSDEMKDTEGKFVPLIWLMYSYPYYGHVASVAALRYMMINSPYFPVTYQRFFR